MLSQIAHVLVLVAQHIGMTDEGTLKKLKLARSRFTSPNRGLKEKPKEALRQFLDSGNIEKLLMLPERINWRLARKNIHTVDGARQMQVAVGLELLLMRPIRRTNLVELRFGEHIRKIGKKTAILTESEDVKNHVALEYEIPPESSACSTFMPNAYFRSSARTRRASCSRGRSTAGRSPASSSTGSSPRPFAS
jgi:hypothetical protein